MRRVRHMELYPAVVFVHAAAILIFFIAHGTSMLVAFALKRETDPVRVRTMLELSKRSIGVPTTIIFVIGLVTGIVVAFMGDHWGTLWIWISLVGLVVIAGLMTPLATIRFAKIGAAAGIPGKDGTATEDVAEMRRLIDAWRPMPVAILGLVGFLGILWLMMAKPF